MTQEGNRDEHAPVTEDLFRELYKYQPPEKIPFRKKMWNGVSCSASTVGNCFPILKWMPKYRLKTDLVGDIIAGMTVAVMHIPHGLAYAPLAGQSPVIGLYMAVFPSILYLFLGTSRHLSLGTFAVVCMMVGKTVSEHVTFDTNLKNGTNDNLTLIYTNLDVGITVCFLVGILQLLMGALHLGALCVLLSNSWISGFTTGAATHVVIYQVKNLLGVSTKSFTGPLKLIYIIIDLIEMIPSSNWVTVGLSFCAILVLSIYNEIFKPIIQKKCPKCRIPVPIELIVIIIGTTISYLLNLEEEHNVRIVKNVPRGLPDPVVPKFELIPALVLDSIVIAVVGVSMALSLAAIFAKKTGYKIDGNQELIAYGVGNIFAAFFQCAPSSASLSRSLVQHSVGGKSQLASIFTMLTIILMLLFLGPLFEPVPYCVLSSIVVVTLKGLVWQVKDFPGMWKLSKLDGTVWLVTFFSVIIVDLDYGLCIGLAMSTVTLVLRGQFPQVSELGRLPNTNIFLDGKAYKETETVNNCVILKISGNLHFANCSGVMDDIINYKERFVLTNFQQDEKRKLAIILDMSCVPSMDPTAVTSLSTLFKDLELLGISLLLSNVNIKVYDFLAHCKFFDKCPKGYVFLSIADAVDYIRQTGQ